MSEYEDEFIGERSMVARDPSAADYETEVTFFRSLAALGVVFGTAGMIAIPFGLLRFHQGTITGDFRVHLFDDPIYSTSLEGFWLFVSSMVGVGLACGLLIGSIGALRLQAWSLVVLRLWAIASILYGIVGSYFYFHWLLPPWRNELAQVRGVVDSLGNLGGWMIGTGLAIAMLILLRRRPVKAALLRNGSVS
jgi:hypothetical protein